MGALTPAADPIRVQVFCDLCNAEFSLRHIA